MTPAPKLDTATRDAMLLALAALDKAGGTALGLAMSTDHPDPDAALQGIFNVCNEASMALRGALTADAGLPVSRPEGVPAEFGYTNWRGEFAVRHAIPTGVRFDATEWHPEPQWLLSAWDTDKEAERDFALVDLGGPVPGEGGWAQPRDRASRIWLVMFEDAERGYAYFDGDDAEAEANAFYARACDGGWNCYLLATQPDRRENRLAVPPSAPEDERGEVLEQAKDWLRGMGEHEAPERTRKLVRDLVGELENDGKAGVSPRQAELLLEAEFVAAQAAVKAVIPLEALVMSGSDTLHAPEVRDGMREGIAAVRAMVSRRSDRSAQIGIELREQGKVVA